MRRVRQVGLAIVFLLVVSCDYNKEPPPCECPRLEAAMNSINWAPGLDREATESARGSGVLAIQLVWSRVGVDPTPQLDRIVAGLESAGFVVEETATGVVATSSQLSVEVGMNVEPELWAKASWMGEDSSEIADVFEPLQVALVSD